MNHKKHLDYIPPNALAYYTSSYSISCFNIRPQFINYLFYKYIFSNKKGELFTLLSNSLFFFSQIYYFLSILDKLFFTQF